jgi:hypothetical protein
LIREIPPDVIPTQVADEVNRRSTVNAITHLSKLMKRKPSFSVEADRLNRETQQKRSKRDDISQNDGRWHKEVPCTLEGQLGRRH